MDMQQALLFETHNSAGSATSRPPVPAALLSASWKPLAVVYSVAHRCILKKSIGQEILLTQPCINSADYFCFTFFLQAIS